MCSKRPIKTYKKVNFLNCNRLHNLRYELIKQILKKNFVSGKSFQQFSWLYLGSRLCLCRFINFTFKNRKLLQGGRNIFRTLQWHLLIHHAVREN